jgi:3-oxoacyl-[acyl-carrier-protein] synthase III
MMTHSQESPWSKSVWIRGMSSYSPEKVVTNHELAKTVDTSDEWIRTRTGVHSRRLAHDKEFTSDLATAAAEKAIVEAKISREDIDLIIVATVTPDMPFPSTAALVQAKLGIKKFIPAFDIEAACAGFVYAIEVASCMLQSSAYRNILVIGADKLSSITDWQDRGTCILFGDGAGAAILSKTSPHQGLQVIDSLLAADGTDPSIVYMPGGGSACPATESSVSERKHFIKMNGQSLFKFAVRFMEQAVRDLLDRNGLTINDIAYIIPHQANLRIIETLGERLQIPKEKVVVHLATVGNTSAASIPIAMTCCHECVGQLDASLMQRLKPGDWVVLVALGAGLSWGATLLRYSETDNLLC